MPSPRLLAAQQSLCQRIEELSRLNPAFAKEVEQGKMFGILIGKKKEDNAQNGISPISPISPIGPISQISPISPLSTREGNHALPPSGELEGAVGAAKGELILSSFSGQLLGSFFLDGFVPPVVDYLQPDGYFKREEREISLINKRIADIEHSPELALARENLNHAKLAAEEEIDRAKKNMQLGKLRRDSERAQGIGNEDDRVRESQHQKAELKRTKVLHAEKVALAEQELSSWLAKVQVLKLERQRRSQNLQQWLFRQFVVTNYKGEQKSLLNIFRTYASANNVRLSADALPPSGSGECCEIKLLNYAFTHGIEVEEMGMFWWGQSPRQEVRHHLHFYPPCAGKCVPILSFMAQGACFIGPISPISPINISPIGPISPISPITIFEDPTLIAINKPAGLLSVHGRGGQPNALDMLREMFPDCPDLNVVHRLDMDTSGILLAAKTREAYTQLQQQFATRTTHKEYIATLEKDIEGSGTISLPLAPDFYDRPRQRVDHDNGKEAITEWHAMGHRRVRLIPHTGRTHQLRVHCAHALGLNNPILGDPLYGTAADRLHLHACRLEFTHPVTGERVIVASPDPSERKG